MAEYKTTVVFSEILPEDVTLTLEVQGGGEARFVVDGNSKSWTSGTMSVTAKEGQQVDVEVQADSGWEFDKFEGEEPPYTIPDKEPYYQ